MDIDTRQAREREYHKSHALRHQGKADEPVADDVVRSRKRRPWNGYWCAYDRLMALELAGKAVLVPGCGFGEDAIRLASLGANVFASDLSEDVLSIARARAEKAGVPSIHFDVMPAEQLTYADDTFDLIFFNDILHHVDIPSTLAETRRVLKPGAQIVINELYTHSSIQKVRESGFVARAIYPRMVSLIYGTGSPYITEDERKINEAELAMMEEFLQPGAQIEYFLLLEGRLFPSRWPWLSRLDHGALKALGFAARRLAGRFVLVGRLHK
jgi:ubiquinone/menaquinone biosynthesis C-methylase UbiE